MIKTYYSFKACTLFSLILLCSVTAFSQTNLSREKAAAIAATELKNQMELQKAKSTVDWAAKQITYKNYTLKFTTQIFGDKPAGGRSLYISLHGGGGTTAAENDQQWENQKRLYKLKEGVYFVPRSPANTWNMWHDYPMDELINEVVKGEIVMDDVNPDKVCRLLGRSSNDGRPSG